MQQTKTHNTQWHIRAYEPGDEEKICELHKQIFPEEMRMDEWRWRYLQNPAQSMSISLAQSVTGELVGQYALMPVTMKVGEGELLCAFSLNTMTHPDYRYQGIFSKLAQHSYQHLQKMGGILTYGFPNKNSRHGFVERLGWRDLAASVPMYAYPLNMKSLVKRKIRSERGASLLARVAEKCWQAICFSIKKSSSTDSLTIKSVETLDERWDTLWEKISITLPIAVKRDRDYLEWRYLKNPLFRYTIFAAFREKELLGYCVLRVDEKFDMKMGYIVDMLALTPDVTEALIKKAVTVFRAQSVDIVSLLMTPSFARKYQLRRQGFLRLSSRLLPQKMFFGVCAHTDTIAADFIYNADNWYVTWGDHDRA